VDVVIGNGSGTDVDACAKPAHDGDTCVALAARVRSLSHWARSPDSGASKPTSRTERPCCRIVSPSITSMAPGAIGSAALEATVAMSIRMPKNLIMSGKSRTHAPMALWNG
jgi:hypothetical protein